MNRFASPVISRRRFLSQASAVAALVAGAPLASAADDPPRRILLRSSWQTVNIGDIAHTPGMLALLERHLPDAEITLWPNQLSDDVERLLRTPFPKLTIAAKADEQEEALERCDFCLHGSGPGLVGAIQLATWQKMCKPYG